MDKTYNNELKDFTERNNNLNDESEKKTDQLKNEIMLLKSEMIIIKESESHVKQDKIIWGEIVSKEVDDKLLYMQEDLLLVQNNMKDVIENQLELEDKEKRKNKVLIYNVEESQSDDGVERMRDDKIFCQNLFTEVLKVGYEADDIKMTVRLGRRDVGNIKRPILVEFKSDKIKNLIMENASKLGRAAGLYKGVTMSHDMTKKERLQCKEMVAEARIKQTNDESGEWVFKVRGPPGQMKVLKLRKYH